MIINNNNLISGIYKLFYIHMYYMYTLLCKYNKINEIVRLAQCARP